MEASHCLLLNLGVATATPSHTLATPLSIAHGRKPLRTKACWYVGSLYTCLVLAAAHSGIDNSLTVAVKKNGDVSDPYRLVLTAPPTISVPVQ